MDSAQAKIFAQALLGTTVGGWTLDRVLGHGKSAVVMGGHKDGVRGAIKVFHPELVELFGRETQLERIRRERSLIGYKHPNLVEILDGGECPETRHLFVVMEELPWRNLKVALSDIPASRIKAIIRQVALAAKALEDRGLAHRDIKPENIAISDDLENVKLLDMGVIRPFGISGLTDVNTRPFIGTLRYSSPEFLRREEADNLEGWRGLSIYQIGAVLHDLLTKTELFSAQSEPYAVLVEAVLTRTPDVSGEDAELVRICKYSLVKSPETRLRLVGFADFIKEESSSPVENLRDRIAARQTYSKEVNEGASLPAGEAHRLLRRNLEEACATLYLKLAVLLGDKVFPLHGITQAIDENCRTAICAVLFDQNEALGLPYRLSADLALGMVDESEKSPIFSLTGTSTLALPTGDVTLSKREISAGEIGAIVAGEKIEEWLLSVLEAAYAAIDKA